MSTEIKTVALGKVSIYLKGGDVIQSSGWRGRLFPTSTLRAIIQQARQAQLMHAYAYRTQTAYQKGGRIQQQQIESDNAGLTVVVEMIDTRFKLEQFVKDHQTILYGKTILYSHVEYWDIHS